VRLRSDIWVDAYRRRCEQLGGFVTLRRRGGREAGAIFLCLSRNDRSLVVYGPAPQSAYAHEGMSRKFVRLNQEPWTVLELEPFLDKQIRFDPDLWVLDIEDGRGRHFLLDDELFVDKALASLRQA
jgi:hypothetical protein